MNQALLKKKLKDSLGDVRFTPSEDSLTSSTIGLLQYLSGTQFWEILRESCGESQMLPKFVGELNDIYFWKRFLPDLEFNVSHVEPDVYCEFDKMNLIIEAKKGDAFGQDINQWRKEINSYFKEIESEKPLLFIAIGGNNSLRIRTIKLDDSGRIHTVYGASWQRLLEVCVDRLHNLMLSNSERRILNDIVALFRRHHFYSIRWLKELCSLGLSPQSTEAMTSWSNQFHPSAGKTEFLFDLASINLKKLDSYRIMSTWKIR